jgi:quercetin dioxygenase-like cupin family protein
VGAVFRFVFPANVAHATKNTGSRASVFVCFSTVPHDPANTVRDVVMPG